MFKTIFSFLLAFIFLLTFVSPSTQSLGTFKVNSTIALVQGCDNSTYSNISLVYYPNGTTSINSENAMIPSGDFYTLSYTKNQIYGTYQVYGHCDENGVDTLWAYTFTINYSGKDYPTDVIWLYIIAILTEGALIYLCIKGVMNIPRENPKDEYGDILSISKLKYFVYALILGAWFLTAGIFFILSNVAVYYFAESLIYKLFLGLFTVMMRLGIVLVILMGIYVFLKILDDGKVKELIERGLPTNGHK